MRSKILLFTLLSLFAYMGVNAQVLQEGFENGVPPAGWAILDNGIGLNQSWTSNSDAFAGDSCARITWENVSSGIAEDWIITPALTLGSGDSLLTFYQKQSFGSDFGSIYTIRVSTDSSQTDTAAYTIIDTQSETDFGTSYAVHSVSLAAYTGQTIYIAFVMTNDDGDRWFIDDVEVGGVPCGIFNLAASNITTTSADLNWNSISAMNEVEVQPQGAGQTGTGTVVTGNSFTASGLMAGGDYTAYVRALCGGPGKILITGAFDGPLPGGQPKGVELYVIDDIADMSAYGVSSANNGGGTTVPNPEFVFPAISANAGDYFYLTSDSAAFNAFFGFNADYVSSAMFINGDDAVELIQDSTTVIDVFGDVNTDGTGEPWEYRDGWAYRMNGAVPNGGTFVDSLWNYSGTDQLEGNASPLVNDSTNSPFPLGTFSTPSPSAWVTVDFTTLCAPVLGDSAQNAIAVTTPVFSDSGFTTCYTNQVGNASNDAWYQVIITDPCVTSIDASLCGSGFDTFIRLLDGSLSSIATNDDACGLQSEILDAPVSVGDTVYVVVEGFSSNNGFYTLSISQNAIMPVSDISYPSMSYCVGDSNPTPSILADTTGMFTSGAGLVLDSITGTIDIAASTAGTYAVLYTVGVPGCEAVDTAMVTLNPADSATFAYGSLSYCLNDSNPTPNITGTTGGTFASSMNLSVDANTGLIDLAASMPGSYTITYTTNGICPATDSVSLTITPEDSASISYSAANYCLSDTNPTPTILGSSGTFLAVPGLSIDSVGTIDLALSTPGSYTVSYVTNGSCPTTATAMVTISAQDDATFAFGSAFYCLADSINPSPSSVATSGGTFSSTTGLSVNAMTGEIDLIASSLDSFHVLTYITNGPCPDTATVTVGVVSCPLSINDRFETGQYTLFPIPNQGLFFVKNNGDAEATTVEVMDMTGRVLFNQAFFFQAGDKQEISLNNAAAGTYFLRVRTETRVETLRLQVAH